MADNADNVLSLVISIVGFCGWLWVWSHSGYSTGKKWQTQIGVLLIGFTWFALGVASTLQDYEPTSWSNASRAALVVGLWLLSPKLKRCYKNGGN